MSPRDQRIELDRLQRIALDPGSITQDEFDDLVDNSHLDDPCECGGLGCEDCYEDQDG